MTDFESEDTRPGGRGARLLRLLVVFPLIGLVAYLFATSIVVPPQRAELFAGDPLPPLVAAGWLNSEPPPREELAGKVVVVDAWFAGCVYCRKTAPELVALHAKYKDRGVVFIGLTPDDKELLDASRKYLEDFSITWPNGYGALQTLDRLNVAGYPSTFVVSREGRIVWDYNSPGTLGEAIELALTMK